MKKILVIFIAAGLILSLWLGYKTALGLAKYLPAPYQGFLSRAHFSVKRAGANLFDALLPQTYWHGYYREKLKNLNLLVSSADIKKIESDEQASIDQGYNDKQTAANQKIKVIYSQHELPANLGFHGGGANDFIFSKSDYDLKLNQGKTIDGRSNFTLFNPKTHNWLVPLLANRVAERLNLYYNLQEPVTVRINGKNKGVFILEEKIDETWLKRQQLENSWLIKLRDETRLLHRINTVALNAHHLSGWDLEIANVDPLRPEDQSVMFELDSFFKAIKARDLDKIKPLIDLDYWARYEAYRELLGVDHDVAGDDLILFFSESDRKFYPVVRSEGDLNALAIEAGSTVKSYNRYDPHLAKQYDYPRIFLLLNQLPEFRALKYGYLHQLLSDYAAIKGEFRSLYSQYANAFIFDTSDELSAWTKNRRFREFLDIFDNNFSLINQEINFGQLGVNLITTADQLTVEVLPDSLAPLQFDNFQVLLEGGDSLDLAETVNQRQLMSNFDQEADVITTVISFPIKGRYSVIGVKAEASNKLTHKPVPVYWAVAADPNQP